MKILITGGAGFIGSNFIFYMMDRYPEYEFVCVDKLTYAGSLDTIRPVLDRSNFVFYKADICDRGEMYRIFEAERPDVVVNFAAESHVDRSIDSPEVFLDSNIKGVSVLMDACMRYDVGRFHQISTDEVYGDLPLDRLDLLFTEESPICPSSPYSSSKAAADLLVMAYHRTYGLPVTISRCSNNYGPYQYPEKLIPLMVTNALADRPLPVYGQCHWVGKKPSHPGGGTPGLAQCPRNPLTLPDRAAVQLRNGQGAARQEHGSVFPEIY